MLEEEERACLVDTLGGGEVEAVHNGNEICGEEWCHGSQANSCSRRVTWKSARSIAAEVAGFLVGNGGGESALVREA